MFRFFGLILKWPKTTLLVIGLLAFLGWHLTSQLAVDVFPDIAVPQIVIQTEAGGLSADEVERLVTMPIESSVNGLPG
ncbi:MAG: efflux RND transporter permease subunit, partial [Kiritimatiellae bacterium]|nr:efflux RND transporter permease subunit [Kiritimatiellia bacterium]